MAITYHSGRRIQSTGIVTQSTSSTGSSGNATNNGSGFTATTGLIGSGMSQASGNYRMTNEPILGDEWSFNYWCIPQVASGNDYFMQMSNDTGGLQSVFYMYNNSSSGLRMSALDSSGTELGIDSSNNPMYLVMTNGSWNMITMVWDNTAKQLKTYKNGVLYGTSKTWNHTNAGNFGTPNKDWYMLNYNAQTGTTYASRTSNLDEWSWWTGSLSQADITELYNGGSGIKANELSSANKLKLIVYYDFEDSPNGTLTNQAPTTATIPDVKPTNVQSGSRFEEAHTRKMYNYDDEVPSTSASTATTENDNGVNEQVMSSANFEFIGEKVVNSSSALYGLTVNKIGFMMKKREGSPTGTATACVMDSSANILYTFGTVDVSTLPSTYTWTYFTNTLSTYTLTTGNYIGIKYSGGDSSNRIGIYWDNAGSYDGTDSQGSEESGGAWNDRSGQDLRFKIFTGTAFIPKQWSEIGT